MTGFSGFPIFTRRKQLRSLHWGLGFNGIIIAALLLILIIFISTGADTRQDKGLGHPGVCVI